MIDGNQMVAGQQAAEQGAKFEDIEFLRHGDLSLLARIYRPAGTGPFPAVVDIHGGGWNHGDRTNNDYFGEGLSAAGILVASIDFRQPPGPQYPSSLADINYGIRWLKARAREFGTRADWVGGYGTSSGGHQILLTALRPRDPRYAAIPLAEAPALDAALAFVVSGWGVIDPVTRYHLARERGNQAMLANHHAFWGSEAAMSEGSPLLALERGEKAATPPALVFQGTEDEWVPRAVAERFAAAYRAAGGRIELALYDGEPHTFLRKNPDSPNSKQALARVKRFIHALGAG